MLGKKRGGACKQFNWSTDSINRKEVLAKKEKLTLKTGSIRKSGGSQKREVDRKER